MNKYKIAKIGLVSYFSCLAMLSYSFYERTPPKSSLKAFRLIKEQVIDSVIKDKYISSVIAKKKHAYLIAAIKKVESDIAGPLTKGDNGESIGMYQIQPKHHGKVPDTVEGQTDKCSEILESLLKTRPRQQAVAKYNGSGDEAISYSAKVMKLVREMEQKERELTFGNKRRNT